MKRWTWSPEQRAVIEGRVFHPEDSPADQAARLDEIAPRLGWTPTHGQKWGVGNGWMIVANCGRCGQHIVAHWVDGAHMERVVRSMFDLAVEAHKLDCPESGRR